MKNMTARQIADTMGVNYKTVQMHIGNIYRKFHVHSRQELVNFLDSNNLWHIVDGSKRSGR